MDAELTFFDQMERDRQAQAAELEKVKIQEANATYRAKLDARGETKEMAMWILITAFIAAAVVAVIFVLWQANKGPSAKQQLEDKWRTDCIAHNGTWVPADSRGGGDPMCVAGHSTIVR